MFDWAKKLLPLLALLGCGGQPPSAPPGLTPAPEITEGGYATYQTTRIFEAPIVPLRAWINEENRIVAAMEETDRIKKPVEITVLEGDWPDEGAKRRLKLSDGHYVLEQVLENDYPTLFRYQVWDFTSAAGTGLKYAVGEQAFRDLGDGRTELVWTYSLKPRSFVFAPFIRGFVENDMRPLMDGALDRTVEQARAHFHGER